LAASVTALWTTVSGATDIIQSFVLCNYTVSTVVTFSIYKVPASATPASSNLIISNATLSAGLNYTAKELFNQVMGAGDSIQAVASSATAVSVNAGGMRNT
jgi:hypothetical protein